MDASASAAALFKLAVSDDGGDETPAPSATGELMVVGNNPVLRSSLQSHLASAAVAASGAGDGTAGAAQRSDAQRHKQLLATMSSRRSASLQGSASGSARGDGTSFPPPLSGRPSSPSPRTLDIAGLIVLCCAVMCSSRLPQPHWTLVTALAVWATRALRAATAW